SLRPSGDDPRRACARIPPEAIEGGNPTVRSRSCRMAHIETGASAPAASERKSAKAVCAVTGRERPRRDLVSLETLRPSLADRLRSESDYRVNLKAELEIRHLHEKMDHLITRQWQRLAEIQQMQLEIMHETSRAGRRS